MDCCKTKEDNGCCKDMEKHKEISEKVKGGTKMEKEKIALWIVIGILLLAVIYTVFFQTGGSTGSLSSNAGQAASAYSGMVGGC